MNAVTVWRPQLDTVYHMDALAFLRQIPDGTVHCIVTSPPYNLAERRDLWASSKKSNWHAMKLRAGYDTFDDAMPRGEYIKWQRSCLHEMMRVLHPAGAVFYVHKWRVVDKSLVDCADIVADFPVRQIIIWNRGSGHNHNPAFFTPCYEVVYLIPGRDFRVSKKAAHLFDVWDIQPARNNTHPAPFPVELARRCILSVDGSIVADPFMGSGTTAVAAFELGRHYMGCDISAHYVDEARRRLGYGVTMPLFAQGELA